MYYIRKLITGSRLSLGVWLALLVLLVPAAAVSAPAAPTAACAYTKHQIDKLAEFSQLVGQRVNCAVVFSDALPTWSDWEKPWFLQTSNANFNWAKWKTAESGRKLIVSPGMGPLGMPNDWRQRGARGEYDSHAVALAKSLVSTGLGDSIIRLGHEGNGNWFAHSIGNNAAEYNAWKQYWARITKAMDSVPGANFKFDLNIAAGYRPIPFDLYYPGDDVVDIIGFDLYDTNVGTTLPVIGKDRWTAQYNTKLGAREVIEFGKSHHKPLSIPEWGIVMPDEAKPGPGDNPAFVEGIADIVRNNDVVYQSYWYVPKPGKSVSLQTATKSLSVYRNLLSSGS
jgi:hypothetical protein